MIKPNTNHTGELGVGDVRDIPEDDLSQSRLGEDCLFFVSARTNKRHDHQGQGHVEERRETASAGDLKSVNCRAPLDAMHYWVYSWISGPIRLAGWRSRVTECVATASSKEVMMMSFLTLLFVLAETKKGSQAPYTFRKVRTIRDCLDGLALMI